ncbi:hypothetical protein D3C85_856110 [compost metagenome]
MPGARFTHLVDCQGSCLAQRAPLHWRYPIIEARFAVGGFHCDGIDPVLRVVPVPGFRVVTAQEATPAVCRRAFNSPLVMACH